MKTRFIPLVALLLFPSIGAEEQPISESQASNEPNVAPAISTEDRGGLSVANESQASSASEPMPDADNEPMPMMPVSATTFSDARLSTEPISFRPEAGADPMMPKNGTTKDATGAPPTSATSDTPKPQGTLRIGYASRYEYAGFALNRDVASTGGMVFEGDVSFDDNDLISPLLTLTYRDMSLFDCKQQVNFIAGIRRSHYYEDYGILISSKLGYQLVSGGLPGLMKHAKEGKEALSTYTNGSVNELISSYTACKMTDQGNVFSSVAVTYAFSGLTGWKIDSSLGYEYPMNEYVSATISYNLNWSFGYWLHSSGIDSSGLMFSLPMTVTQNATISPFLLLEWGAHNAFSINRFSNTRIIDNFAPVGGVRVIWSF